MSWLTRKQKGYLGIDFGAGGVKVVQLAPRDSRGTLHTYGFSELAPEEMGVSYLDNPEAAGILLKQVCAKARTTVTAAVAALPIPSVFSAVLSIAQVPRKELRQAVEWEAKKLIPLPLEDVTLDFRELKHASPSPSPADKDASKGEKGEPEKTEPRGLQVLLTAAPKSIIEKYLTIAKHAGIELSSLETEAFALIRATIGTDPAPVVLIDIGALRSNILFVDQGIPMLTRSVEIGGKKCTEAIAAALQISLTQAEALKRDLGARPLPGTSAGQIPSLLRETLTPLVNELHYSFSVYKTHNHIARAPEKIILVGGGAGLSGLSEMLTTEFNLRTFLGNPWERVDFHSDLRPLIDAFGNRFAVAVGLALRNI